MNKDEIIMELNNDNCEIDNQLFEKETIDKIQCDRLVFNGCTFTDVEFTDNHIEWIEFNQCKFTNTVINGILQNSLILLSNNFFNGCKISDFGLFGYDEQSEIIDNYFENCTFSNICIKADLSILGGHVDNCTGNRIDCKMNMVFETMFSNCNFEDVKVDVAIKKNTFHFVNINNFDFEGVNEKNQFQDCFVNNETINM